MDYELRRYDDQDLAFADGDDFLENADGSGYTGMHDGIFYAGGYPANGEMGGIFFADGVPVKQGVPAIARKRNPNMPQMEKENKYRSITIRNAKNAARDFYLFHSLEGITGTINGKTAFAAIDDTGTDTSLSVVYFDEDVEQFLSNFRKGGVEAEVDFVRLAATSTTTDLAPYKIVAESLPDGQRNWVQDVIIHNAGYASEMAMRSHILTLPIGKNGQNFQLGKKASRVKFTAPPSTDITIFFKMGKVMDIGRAFSGK